MVIHPRAGRARRAFNLAIAIEPQLRCVHLRLVILYLYMEYMSNLHQYIYGKIDQLKLFDALKSKYQNAF